MIAYNVTIKIDQNISTEWLEWMQTVHIPEVMATGCFSSYRLARIMDMNDENPTFSIQYICADTMTLHQYQVEHAEDLQMAHTIKFKDKFVAFRSIMEIIAES